MLFVRVVNFLKAEPKKAIIFIFFFTISFYPYRGVCPANLVCSYTDIFYRGIPLPVKGWSEDAKATVDDVGNNRLEMIAQKQKFMEFNSFLFLLNVMFWYFVTCLLVLAWNKVKTKKQ